MPLERVARLEARMEAQDRMLADLKREISQNRQERRESDQILFAKIDDLTALANRGKGALSLLVTAGTIAGGLIGWLANHFLTR